LNYSEAIRTTEGRSRFSWIILKAHTSNQGKVRLRTSDPRDSPAVNFRSFGDGGRDDDPDLKALQWGVDRVREFMDPLRRRGITQSEYLPGIARTGQALSEFVKPRAWGHHASCTCRIGDPSINAVLSALVRNAATNLSVR
jgi:choline dehydrogenase